MPLKMNSYLLIFFFSITTVISVNILRQGELSSSSTNQLPQKPNDVNITNLLKLKSIHRNIDGSENNPDHPQWGKSWTNIKRRTAPAYEDGKSQMLKGMPNSRLQSQTIGRLFGNKVQTNSLNLTMLFGTWGQFLDHDITLSDEQKDEEQQIVNVPRCDPFLDKQCTGKVQLKYHRSKYNKSLEIRTNINQLTAWIDASQVYGSTKEVADNLREFKKGKLKTSPGNMLPIDQDGQYYAGDIRATQNMGLTCLQILFLREHNRLCDLILERDPSLDDEEVYGIARNYVIGLLQKISFEDYLPKLFGQQHFQKLIGAYKGYNSTIDPTIFTEFSTTAYRIGHPYITNIFKLVDNNNITQAKLSLTDLYLAIPSKLTYTTVNLLLKGLSYTLAKQRNLYYVDELRNANILGQFLDLYTINLERSLDHGVPDYNSLRKAWNLTPRKSFSQIFQDDIDRRYALDYFNSVDNINAYIGVLGEDVLEGSIFGELGAVIAGEQFGKIRDGDRFWYESAYPQEVVEEIKSTTISDVIERNSDVVGMALEPFKCQGCTYQ